MSSRPTISAGGILGKARRIVVLRALYLGDMLVAMPALRILRAAAPDAEISFIGLPWARDFVERYGVVDRFLDFPGVAGIPEVPYDPERTRRFLDEAVAQHFDVAIQMHGDGSSSNAFVAGLGARFSIGYARAGGSSPLDLALPYPEPGTHEVVKQLRLLEALGVATEQWELSFPLLDRDFDELASLLPGLDAGADGPLVGIHPGSKMPSRRWPAARYAALADRLAEAAGARIVLTGGPGEIDLVADVTQHMSTPAIDLAGKTSLGALAALISRCALFVGNDSGPSHLAVALRRPSIMIFGPGNVARWRPMDSTLHRIVALPVPCAPCEHWDCPIDHRCLTRVSVDRVLDVARELLHERQACASRS
jgi:lipopolysaccharide heptosyltransferase II